MPNLHAPKVDPLAISIPRPGGGEGSLYMIERLLCPGKSFQFEALVSGQHYNESHPCRTWQWQRPEPGLIWADNYLPEEWHHSGLSNPAKMVSLGSGRFCIIRFLETLLPSLDTEQIFVDKQYAVFTGLEVVLTGKVNANGNGNSNGNRLRMA
ncbi:hypothetical protein TRIUR3_33590 [Triticum urartu]|uniref:Uncharacterized protein n=1 Tax=Triticum urartu TaxID=4572 RepID=M7ZXV9_TRIUA|nr:hypothetical protein TRIUR3_33590 [Triticum urartu]